MREGFVIDPWTPLDYKQVFGDASTPFGQTNAPWLTTRDRRRLSAYIVLAAYAENAARHLYDGPDPERNMERREYGDPSLVIEQALTHLLGEDQTIVVPQAEGFKPDADDKTENVDALGGVERTTDPDAPQAFDMQERLREWWDDGNLDLVLLDAERKAVTLGDTVYLLWWDEAQQKPRVTVVDPGFYFPVLPTGLTGPSYPDKVHFLWETPAEETEDGKPTVTRVTYEMDYIRPEYDAIEGVFGIGAVEETLREGDRYEVDDQGVTRIVRDLPWEDEPVARTCYMTEMTWKAQDIRGIERNAAGVDNIATDHGVYGYNEQTGQVLNHVDLGIDFLPIVHIPNTVPGEQHFGQALISKAAQNLDDLQSADTDAAAAAATTGSPMIGLAGVQTPMVKDPTTGKMVPQGITIAPGRVFQLGESGSMSTVNTAPQLLEMRNHVNALLKRFQRNVRLPEEALGQVETGENGTMSGLAIQLRYGPLEGLIRGMRLARSAKYPIFLKFVQRFFMLEEGYDGPSETFKADLVFGSFLPQDQAGAIERAKEAYEAEIISLETAVAMLMQAGVPIEDAVEEIQRIQRRSFVKAGSLADATGDVNDARRYLGLEAVEPPEPEPVVVVEAPPVAAPPIGGAPTTETPPPAG